MQLLFLSFFSLQLLAHAAQPTWGPLEIQIEISEDQAFAQIDGKKLKILPANTRTQSDLEKLSHGDIIAGEAKTLPDLSLVVFRSIERVGLRGLIGLWKHGNFGDLYHFRNFSELEHYKKSPDPRRSHIDELSYLISPSESSGWNLILASRNQSPVLATLHLYKNKLRLSFFDSQTGEISKTLFLEKL